MMLKELFEELDDDNSNMLDIDEVGELARRLGIKLTQQELEVAMSEMDNDGSGGGPE